MLKTNKIGNEWRYALTAASGAVAILAIFIHKAYFLDSYIYLMPAEAIRQTPLDPYNVSLGGLGTLFYKHTHPPLTSYLIAPIVLFGDIMKEWQVNLIFVLLGGLTAAAFYFLGKGYLKHKLTTALLFVVSPAFLISFNQVNADPVAFALWVVSAAFLLAATKNGSTPLFLLSGLAAGFSCLAAFQSLVLLPLFAAYLFFKRYKGKKALLTFLVAILVFSLWCIQNYVYYGRLQLFHASDAGHAKVSLDLIFLKSVSALSLLGGAGIFPAIYIYVSRKERFGTGIFAATLLAATTFVFAGNYADIASYTVAQKLLLTFFLTVGLSVAVIMFLELARSFKKNLLNGDEAENLFFLFWFWGVLLYNILIMPFESVRYLLPAYVPLTMVYMRKAEAEVPTKKAYVLVTTVSLLCGAVLGISLLYADYRHADIYRKFAQKIGQGRLFGKEVYFDGNWGFWFYMEKRGAKRIYVYNRPLKEGDIFIIPTYTSPKAMNVDLASHFDLLSKEVVHDDFPLRLLNKEAEAGFYSQVWGFLPYSFSTEPLDTFNICRYREESFLQSKFSGNLGELESRRKIILEFTSNASKINGMGFRVGTYNRKNTGQLYFALKDLSGKIIVSKVVDLSSVRDNSWMVINFPEVEVIKGNRYTAELTSPQSYPGNAVTFYYSNDNYQGNTLFVDGSQIPGALTFAVYGH